MFQFTKNSLMASSSIGNYINNSGEAQPGGNDIDDPDYDSGDGDNLARRRATTAWDEW